MNNIIFERIVRPWEKGSIGKIAGYRVTAEVNGCIMWCLTWEDEGRLARIFSKWYHGVDAGYQATTDANFKCEMTRVDLLIAAEREKK